MEALVALTLLTTVLSVSVPMVVRHGRLLTTQRDYRLALDELSNQLERLTALPTDALPAALANLTPSAWAAARLVDVDLQGSMERLEFAHRVTLRLSWDEPGRQSAPLTLTGWVYPAPFRFGPAQLEEDAL